MQSIAKQLVKALHYLHSNRIIHRWSGWGWGSRFVEKAAAPAAGARAMHCTLL